MPKDYKPIPRILTAQDREFIRLVAAGEKRTRAFRIAYPDHPSVKKYMDIINGKKEPAEGERVSLSRSIIQLSKDKVQSKAINARLQDFEESMNVLAAKSMLVANDLLDNGRSEKVKADLAIEFIRHKVGSPTVQVQQQVDKTVHLSFGNAPARDDMSDIIEGEVI